MENPPGRDASRRRQQQQQQQQGRPMGPRRFPDPFAGFGGRSLLQDFFGNDPFFNDPFFTQPLGGMFGNSGSPFGAGSFFEPPRFPSMFGGGFPGGGFPGQHDPRGGFLEQRSYNQQPEARRGPVIEEVTGDHDEIPHGRSNDEPIIEHPDDEVRGGDRHVSHSQSQSRSVTPRFATGFGGDNNGRFATGFGGDNNGNARGYTYQSASVTYGGIEGPYYSSSMRRRAASNGVVEEELEEKDSTGKEEYRHSRGLREKGRTVTRKRNADGREDNFQTFHNLAEAEVQDFDKTWEAHAEAALPGWNARTRTAPLPNSQPGSSRARPALPSSGGGSSKWTGAKRARVDLQTLQNSETC